MTPELAEALAARGLGPYRASPSSRVKPRDIAPWEKRRKLPARKAPCSECGKPMQTTRAEGGKCKVCQTGVLSEEEIATIKRERAEGGSLNSLARRYGVSRDRIKWAGAAL